METESINNILKKKDKTYSISLKNYEKNTHLKVKTDELVNKIRTNLNTLKRLEKDDYLHKTITHNNKTTCSSSQNFKTNFQKFDKIACASLNIKSISPYIDNINQTLRLRPHLKNPNVINDTIYLKYSHCNTESHDPNDYSEIFDREVIPMPHRPIYKPKVYIFRKEPKRTMDTKTYTPNYTLVEKSVHYVTFSKRKRTVPKIAKEKPMCHKLPRILKERKDNRWDGYNNALKFEKYTQRKEFAE